MILTTINAIKNSFIAMVRRLRNQILSFMQVKTIGVRALIVNCQDQILLVRHTYLVGWYLPGGTLEHGETPQAAIIREISEETGLTDIIELSIFSVYLNRYEGRDDYPVLYTAKVTDPTICINDHAEIANAAWFDINNLPSGTTPGTRSRIQEYFKHQELTGIW